MFNRRAMVVAAILVAAACGAVPPRGSAPPRRLRVVSYNIFGARGYLTPEMMADLSKVLRRLNPDLIALQEVDQCTPRSHHRDTAMELGKTLGLSHVFGPAVPRKTGWYGNAMLSRWPVTVVTNLALPTTEGHEKRAMLAARVAVPAHAPFLFMATHFDAGDDDFNRNTQSRAVAAWIPANAEGILAGDFNAVRGSAPMKILDQKFIHTTGVFARPTFPSRKPRKRIDHVLLSRALRWRVVEVRTGDELFPRDPAWKELLARASDHLPVLVVLESIPAP